MRRLLLATGWLGLVLTAFGQDPAPQPPADRSEPDPPGLRPSQLALSGMMSLGQVRFRATVLAKGNDSLLLLTAAHCLAPEDAGRTLQLAHGDDTIEARVRVVVRNPAFGHGPAGAQVPGADNALVALNLKADGDHPPAWLDRLEPATLALSPVPGPDGRTIPIYAIDQFEKAHGVRAGNYSNPRWLEWGPGYKPIPGDSGGGVFAYRRRPDGPPVPILIGVVTDRSPRGGGASIVSRRDRWISAALRPRDHPHPSGADEGTGH